MNSKAENWIHTGVKYGIFERPKKTKQKKKTPYSCEQKFVHPRDKKTDEGKTRLL